KWMREYGAATETQHGILLQIRIGINYGSVVAASLATGERLVYDVVGDAANVAQRVESSAEPGTVCASEPFYRLTLRSFLYRQRGSTEEKGRREPLQLFQLLGEREEVIEGSVPLVGRERELEELRQATRRLRRGHTTLVGVTGAAGMGKTRLLEALAQELA